MDQPDLGAEPNFTRPVRQIILMLVALGLVGFGVFIALPKVLPVFLANLYLNGFIGFVFVIGLFATLWQVVQVFASVSWIKGHVHARAGHDANRPPRLLAPHRRGRFSSRSPSVSTKSAISRATSPTC